MPPRERIIRALHIFALCALAIAQPLFDLLSRNATFFIANAYTRTDILIFTAILCVGIPSILTIVTFLARLISLSFSEVLHLGQIGILSTLGVIPFVKLIKALPGAPIIILALILGGCVTWLYHRRAEVRSFYSILTLGIAVVPLYFLFLSPVSQLVVGSQSGSFSQNIKFNPKYPVIVVIFDEFSSVSLMDENQQIDSARCPNFAALARDASWFRNATTVSEQTEHAVPAILTGKRPIPGSSLLPTAADYPNNLFTLLGNSYPMQVFESQTFLCPPSLKKNTRRSIGIDKRLTELFTDVSVLYAYLILPAEYTSTLPSIHQRWGRFIDNNDVSPSQDIALTQNTDAAIRSRDIIQAKINTRMQRYAYDRRQQWQEFIDSFSTGEQPSFHFLHILLPHFEWEFLPSGKSYLIKSRTAPIPGLKAEDWQSDEWAVLEGYKRYLLQVGAVDLLLGRLLDSLKQKGIYKDCLLIITADHGVSFRPNQSRRLIDQDNAGDILPVPLFIKTPHQTKGIISDRNVETIDILPTITDILDISIPWDIDGRSIFDTTATERPEKLVTRVGNNTTYQRYPFNFPGRTSALIRQLSLFGSGPSFDGSYRIQGYGSLLGTVTSRYPVAEDPSCSIWIENEVFYHDVDKAIEPFLADLTGQINRPSGSNDNILAVAINDTIRSVTKTLPEKPNEFSDVIPEQYFKSGANSIEIYFVDGKPGKLRLTRPSGKSEYSIVQSEMGAENVRTPQGKILPLTHGKFYGSVDSIYLGKNSYYVWGWAADIRGARLPNAILVFVKGDFIHVGEIGTQRRPELAKNYKNSLFEKAGYRFDIISPQAYQLRASDFRVVALYPNGEASELPLRSAVPPRDTPPLKASKIDQSQDTLFSSDGKTYTVRKNFRGGSVDKIYFRGGRLMVLGWAADVQSGALPEAIALFERSNYITRVKPGDLKRAELAAAYQIKQLIDAGFRVDIPFETSNDPNKVDVRVFALYPDGYATELPIHSKARQ